VKIDDPSAYRQSKAEPRLASRGLACPVERIEYTPKLVGIDPDAAVDALNNELVVIVPGRDRDRSSGRSELDRVSKDVDRRPREDEGLVLDTRSVRSAFNSQRNAVLDSPLRKLTSGLPIRNLDGTLSISHAARFASVILPRVSDTRYPSGANSKSC
jgi:hypothetical protein